MLLLALAACGDDNAGDSPPTDSSPTDSGAAAPVTLVSGTAGGGDVETQATDVTDPAALASYVERLDGSLASEVTAAAGELAVGADESLLAQIVAVGCDVPPSAALEGDVIVPAEVPSPMKECFAPVTTVGLVAAPA